MVLTTGRLDAYTARVELDARTGLDDLVTESSNARATDLDLRSTLELADPLQSLVEPLLRIAALYPPNGTALFIVPGKSRVRHRCESQGTHGPDHGAEKPDSEHVAQTEGKILTNVPEEPRLDTMVVG